MKSQCTDRVVGNILAGWRYDISGITPEMRCDYQAHFDHCEDCRSRRKLHRIIDFSLLLICKAAIVLFAAAFLAVRHFHPPSAFIMQIAALGGIAISAIVWVIVCMTTPVPVMVFGAVKEQARKVHERLPEEIKARIPEQLAAKLAE
jgi:hypothetical protein